MRIVLLKIVLLFLVPNIVFAETLKVAVASNFQSTMRKIVSVYEEQTGHKVILSTGSSGKHFAQIINGAPYDVFFSADVERAHELERTGFAIKGSRFTYAEGRLVAWGLDYQKGQALSELLKEKKVNTVAIANSRVAPYGKAAEQVLDAISDTQNLDVKIVKGENINQAFVFVTTGNAQLGILSYAQIIESGHTNYWLIPSDLYQPIEQQAVILKHSSAAQSLVDFFKSEQAKKIIRQQGYTLD